MYVRVAVVCGPSLFTTNASAIEKNTNRHATDQLAQAPLPFPPSPFGYPSWPNSLAWPTTGNDDPCSVLPQTTRCLPGCLGYPGCPGCPGCFGTAKAFRAWVAPRVAFVQSSILYQRTTTIDSTRNYWMLDDAATAYSLRSVMVVAVVAGVAVAVADVACSSTAKSRQSLHPNHPHCCCCCCYCCCCCCYCCYCLLH